MSLQKKTIQEFVIVENFINDFINNNTQTVIDSLKPFLQKKLITLNGFVSKYNKPTITITNTDALKEIGITNVFFSYIMSSSKTYTDVEFKFNIFCKNGLFEYQHNNPYGSSYINKTVLRFKHEDCILTKIEEFNPLPLLNFETVYNNYENALTKKQEYENSLAIVDIHLRYFIRR